MKTAKLGALFLVSVMALAGVGASYAHWSETLTVDGVMTTGNIDPIFTCAYSNDDMAVSPDPDEYGHWNYEESAWIGERKIKDIGETNVGFEGTGLEITANNVYPCYYGSVGFCIKNLGSVPVHVHGIKLVEISKGTWKKTVDQKLVACKIYYIDFEAGTVSRTKNLNGDNTDDFSLHLSTLAVCQQLDPWNWEGDFTELYGDIAFHMENGCKETTSYDFTIEIIFNNWGE